MTTVRQFDPWRIARRMIQKTEIMTDPLIRQMNINDAIVRTENAQDKGFLVQIILLVEQILHGPPAALAVSGGVRLRLRLDQCPDERQVPTMVLEKTKPEKKK